MPPDKRMCLRKATSRRLPGRYREDDGFANIYADKPAFIHQDIPFNRQLAKHCAFPSLPGNHAGPAPSEVWRAEEQRKKEKEPARSAGYGTLQARGRYELGENDRDLVSISDEPVDKETEAGQARVKQRDRNDGNIGYGGDGDLGWEDESAEEEERLIFFTRRIREAGTIDHLITDERPSTDYRIVSGSFRIQKGSAEDLAWQRRDMCLNSPVTYRYARPVPDAPADKGGHLSMRDSQNNARGQTDGNRLAQLAALTPCWGQLTGQMQYLVLHALQDRFGLSFIRAVRALDLDLSEKTDLIELTRQEQRRQKDFRTRNSTSMPPDPAIMTMFGDFVSASEVLVAQRFLSGGRGLHDVAAYMAGYAGSNAGSARFYEVELDHFLDEDGWRGLPPQLNNTFREELVAFAYEEKKRHRGVASLPKLTEQEHSKALAMADQKIMVRRAPPPGTMNPRRLMPDRWDQDREVIKKSWEMPPAERRALHWSNYLVTNVVMEQADPTAYSAAHGLDALWDRWCQTKYHYQVHRPVNGRLRRSPFALA